jgi:hypothetical protein
MLVVKHPDAHTVLVAKAGPAAAKDAAMTPIANEIRIVRFMLSPFL